MSRDVFRVGYASLLIIIGLAMLGIIFYTALRTSADLSISVPSNGDLARILAENSRALVELLARVAFLAVALAAGAIVLGKGVDALKGCPEGRGR